MYITKQGQSVALKQSDILAKTGINIVGAKSLSAKALFDKTEIYTLESQTLTADQEYDSGYNFNEKTGTCTRKIKTKDLETERTNKLSVLQSVLEEKIAEYQHEQLVISITGDDATINLDDIKTWYAEKKEAIAAAADFETLNEIIL